MSNKRHTIPEVALKVLSICNERVEAYKAHLIELSKKEAEPKGDKKLCDKCKRPRPVGGTGDVSTMCLCNPKLEKDEMGLQHEVPKAANTGLQHEVPKANAGLQHEVPRTAIAMKSDDGVAKNDYHPPMTGDVAAQAGRGGHQNAGGGPKLSTDFHMPTGPMPTMSGGNVSPTPASTALAQKAEPCVAAPKSEKSKLPRKSKGMK